MANHWRSRIFSASTGNYALRILCVTLLTYPWTAPAKTADSDEGLVREGRWFYYRGEPQWMAGIDFQSAAARKHYDYVQLLDRLQDLGLNKIRLWAYSWFLGRQGLAPWKYHNGKYDLDEWDEAYWQRVRRFVDEAEVRDIFIEFTLFAPYPSRSTPPWWANDEYQLAWNRSYNDNGAFTSNAEGHFYPEFYSLIHPEKSFSGKTLFGYQRALVDKALAELGERKNVFFEIANEFPGDFENRGHLSDSVHWALYWARYVKNRTLRPVSVHAHDSSGAHLRGVAYYNDKPFVDILNFHFYSRQPRDVSDLLLSAGSPRKILQLNESHSYMASEEEWYAAIRESWSAFIGGAYYQYFHSDAYADAMLNPVWLQRMESLAFLRRIAESHRFWELSPYDASGRPLQDTLVLEQSDMKFLVTGKPGSRYIAYLWPSRAAQATADPAQCGQVRLSLLEASYDAQWYDPRDGSLIKRESGLPASALLDIPCPEGGHAETGYLLTLERNDHPRHR